MKHKGGASSAVALQQRLAAANARTPVVRKKPKEPRIAPHRPRGLAAMSPERRREIARKGGQAAQARGTGHRWTVEEARKAGKKSRARSASRQKQSDASDQPSE